MQEQPRQLSGDDPARIRALAEDRPALWPSPQTTAADRKEIVRLWVERVVVHVRADREQTGVDIGWRGGQTTRPARVRPVPRYESLSDDPRMLARIEQWRQEGGTMAKVAKQRNEEGYRTPRGRKGYSATLVRKLLSRQRQRTEGQGSPHQPKGQGGSKKK